jgi:beta-fructofuranosidase
MTDQNALTPEIATTEALIHSARDLRVKYMADRHRPRYHFMPPAGWLNDINGPIYWKGRYHIFYQYNPDEAYWKAIQWGHASSVDLVHWVDHPVALVTDPNGPDRKGCFSGGMVVNDGVPTIIYHGNPDGTCIATSHDDELNVWTKHPGNPVIRVPQPGDANYGRYRVYDPCAWRVGQIWYALCGSHDDTGDVAYLFRSPDMVHWEFMHPFYRSERRFTHIDEDCAVPDFFPLGDRHMLSFSSHLVGAQYYLGRYENDRFYPEQHGRFSWAGGVNAGAITMLDGQSRRLFFTWLLEARIRDRQRAAGWAGVMNLPWVLSMRDGALGIAPIPELSVLRYNARTHPDVQLAGDTEVTLSGIRGDALELAVELEPEGAREFGLVVRASPDGAEHTRIVCSPAEGTLRIDVSRSSLDPDVAYQRYLVDSMLKNLPAPEEAAGAAAPQLSLRPGEPLQLRVFLDRSVLEVFGNGRQAVVQRVYPSRADSLQVRVFALGGGVTVHGVQAWDMASTHS